MEKSSNATELVRDHFRQKASSFDSLYDEEHPLQRAVRPGLLKRRDFALEVVREYDRPVSLAERRGEPQQVWA